MRFQKHTAEKFKIHRTDIKNCKWKYKTCFSQHTHTHFRTGENDKVFLHKKTLLLNSTAATKNDHQKKKQHYQQLSHQHSVSHSSVGISLTFSVRSWIRRRRRNDGKSGQSRRPYTVGADDKSANVCVCECAIAEKENKLLPPIQRQSELCGSGNDYQKVKMRKRERERERKVAAALSHSVRHHQQ